MALRLFTLCSILKTMLKNHAINVNISFLQHNIIPFNNIQATASYVTEDIKTEIETHVCIFLCPPPPKKSMY